MKDIEKLQKLLIRILFLTKSSYGSKTILLLEKTLLSKNIGKK